MVPPGSAAHSRGRPLQRAGPQGSSRHGPHSALTSCSPAAGQRALGGGRNTGPLSCLKGLDSLSRDPITIPEVNHLVGTVTSLRAEDQDLDLSTDPLPNHSALPRSSPHDRSFAPPLLPCPFHAPLTDLAKPTHPAGPVPSTVASCERFLRPSWKTQSLPLLGFLNTKSVHITWTESVTRNGPREQERLVAS